MLKRAGIVGLILASCAVGYGGCGASAESYCNARCDCNGCSDRDYEECLYDYDRDVDYADRRGCGPEWDEYAACVEDYYAYDCGYGGYSCGLEQNRYFNCAR